MPEYRRYYHKGGSYFFTVFTHQRQKILLAEDIRHDYVIKVCDYPYSTFHHYVKIGIYDRDWGSGIEVMGGFGE